MFNIIQMPSRSKRYYYALNTRTNVYINSKYTTQHIHPIAHMHACIRKYIQFEMGNSNASLNYHLYCVCWWLNGLTEIWTKNERERRKKNSNKISDEAKSSNNKKGNKLCVCVRFSDSMRESVYVWLVIGVCMFLLHLFGTVASVQLKTLFRSHRLLCNGIAHNAHTPRFHYSIESRLSVCVYEILLFLHQFSQFVHRFFFRLFSN